MPNPGCRKCGTGYDSRPPPRQKSIPLRSPQSHLNSVCYALSMTRRFRLLFVWLLLALLPIQGMSASMRMTCAAEHSLGNGAEEQIVGKAPGTTHTPHHHHAGMSASEMAAGLASHNDAGHHEHGNHHKHVSCSNCGACCVGAFALPTTLSMAITNVRASVEIVSPSPLVTGFIPDGLERPPRQISA